MSKVFRDSVLEFILPLFLHRQVCFKRVNHLDMRAFIIEKLVILFTGVAIAIGTPFAFQPTLATILIILITLIWGCWCREILLLPLDLLLGVKSEEMYFSRLFFIEHCEFHRGKKYAIWQFYRGDQKIRRLIVPEFKKEKDILSDIPKADQKMLVKYYQLSRIVVTYHFL